MPRSEQHKMIVVDLLPFDPDATREALAGEGVSDGFREVRNYEDGAEIKSAKAYGDAVTFPASIRKERDRAEELSQAGDTEPTRLLLAVAMRDLVVAGIIETTAEVPFKKGDRILDIKDHQDRVIQEWDADDGADWLYVKEVKMDDAATYFESIVLVCESRSGLT